MINYNKILCTLCSLFLALYPWGSWIELNLFNIETNRGISSFIMILIIIIGILNGNFTHGLRLYNKIKYLVIFIVFCTLGTLISGQLNSSFTILSFITYFMLIFIILGLNLSLLQISNFIKLIFYSTSLMVIISILDYHDLISISGLNNSKFNNFDKTLGWINDLTGPFNSRTHFANHLSLVILLPLVYLSNEKKYFSVKSFFNFIVFLIIIYAAILCHSRSLSVSIFLTFLLFLIINLKSNLFKLITLTTLFLLIIINLNTDFFEIVFHRFSSFDISNDNDGIRYTSFFQTLNNLTDNPIGYGFSAPYSESLEIVKDVHSNITYVLRAGGFIGFICLLIFFKHIVKKFIKFRITKTEQFIYIPIFSFLIFGISHTNITTSSFWFFIAFTFSMMHLNYKTNKIYQNK